MPPHGPGFTGATHSHDPEFPDDDWNLYSMLDTTTTRALNITQPQSVIRVFKPFARRLEAEPSIVSDADAEIIVHAVFTSPIILRKLMIIGGGAHENHPLRLRCFVNDDTLDFNNIEGANPVQEFDLAINELGTVELFTSLHRFTNITSLCLHFPANHGEVDSTIIKYIGLQGDHTHYRREPVHAYYEVLCTGQDVPQSEEAGGAHDHLH